jgi:hypothetical protein
MILDHHAHEILRKLDEILAQNEILRTDQLHLREITMASLSDVQAAQATETAAITALAARIVPPAATATDLDGIVATATANTAAITAIDPATAPAP